jgi:hypothetical protein
MSISYDGNEASKKFCSITGFRELSKTDSKGDALEGSMVVEIKKGTYNQVHPYKYNVLVGYHPDSNTWYVIPPDDVIRLLLKTKNNVTEVVRGQHTPDPMICACLGKVNHPKYNKYIVSDADLRAAVIAAYEQGQASINHKNYAGTIYSEAAKLADNRKQQILSL